MRCVCTCGVSGWRRSFRPRESLKSRPADPQIRPGSANSIGRNEIRMDGVSWGFLKGIGQVWSAPPGHLLRNTTRYQAYSRSRPGLTEIVVDFEGIIDFLECLVMVKLEPKTVARAKATASKAKGEALPFTRKNYYILLAGLAVIILGYISLAMGSITLAPILLVLGYCVVVPVAILYRGGDTSESEQSAPGE